MLAHGVGTALNLVACLVHGKFKRVHPAVHIWQILDAYLLLLVAGAGEQPPAAALCTHAIDKCFCTQNATETHN